MRMVALPDVHQGQRSAIYRAFPERQPNSDRLNHISVETDDAEGMRKYLASKGIKTPAKVGKGRIGNANFNVTDPDGHTVEIVRVPAGRLEPAEQGKFMSDNGSPTEWRTWGSRQRTATGDEFLWRHTRLRRDLARIARQQEF